MARKNRFAHPDVAYHVVNRGNDRQTIFRERFDFMAFMELLEGATRRVAVRIYAYVLMSNHFHLLLKPDNDTALSAYMQWVTGRYASTFRQQTDTVGYGHVFQRRFWSTPLSNVHDFVGVLRYIEANPPRANLIARAEDWEWSSLTDRLSLNRGVLAPLPLELPPNWTDFVNTPQSIETLTQIRKAIVPKPGRPRKDEKMGQALFATEAEMGQALFL